MEILNKLRCYKCPFRLIIEILSPTFTRKKQYEGKSFKQDPCLMIKHIIDVSPTFCMSITLYIMMNTSWNGEYGSTNVWFSAWRTTDYDLIYIVLIYSNLFFPAALLLFFFDYWVEITKVEYQISVGSFLERVGPCWNGSNLLCWLYFVFAFGWTVNHFSMK